jgi:CTP:phosphocholine cytidylyltransferase-like protein
MVAFIIEFKLIDQSAKKQLEMIKTTSPEDVVCIYNNAKEMLSLITSKFYTNTLFCCKYRIYKNILKLLYIDLVRFYRICYFCVSENLNNIKKLDAEQAKALHSMCQSFIEVTADTQKQVGGMSSQLKEPLPVLINYFKVTLSLQP